MNNPSRACNIRQSSLNRWDSTSVISGSASMSSIIHERQKFTRDPSAPKYWDLLRIPYICPITNQFCEGGLDSSPSTVLQPFALARERPSRLLHIRHSAPAQKCRRIPRPSSVRLLPSLVVPPAIRRSSEHNKYQDKYTHDTFFIPSRSYCLKRTCCLKKPVLSTNNAPSCGAENPVARVYTVICEHDRFGLSWPLAELDGIQCSK